MTRVFATISFVLCLFWSPAAQQTGLTDAQLKSAAVEVPRLVEALKLRPGMTVADVAAGFGAWTIQFSKWIGPTGRVYATDIGAPQLTALRDVVQQERLTNVTIVEGAVATTNLPASCCDAMLIRDAYHHFTQPENMVRSIARSLRPGGRLAVVDFPPRPNSEIPAGVPSNRNGHGVPPEVVQRELGAALKHVTTTPMWSPDSQPASLYLVLFEKQ